LTWRSRRGLRAPRPFLESKHVEEVVEPLLRRPGESLDDLIRIGRMLVGRGGRGWGVILFGPHGANISKRPEGGPR